MNELARVDLNLLVALEALLAECHVTRAAERVAVGQPAMSASLARLRRHFDDPLLVRQGRAMVRTPLADSLLPSVRDALASVEGVLGRNRSFDPTQDPATFTIIAADYVTFVLLRPLLTEIAAEHPNIRISVRSVDDSLDLQLRRGEVDLVIVPRELFSRRPVFPHVELFSDRWVIVVDADGDVGADGRAITSEEMQQMRFAAYHSGTITPIPDQELDRLGVALDVEVVTQAFVLAPFLIRGTPLATITLERLARELAEPARLRLLESPHPLPEIHEEMYWSPRFTEDPAHRWLRSVVAEHSARLSGRGS